MKDKMNNKAKPTSENMSEATLEERAFHAVNGLISEAHNGLKREGVSTSYVVIGFHLLPEDEDEGRMFAKTITIVDRNEARGPTTALELMRDGNIVAGAATFVKNHKLTETLLDMALSEAVSKTEQLQAMEAAAFIAMLAQFDHTTSEEN